eukprot:Awhi_evm1s15459
MTTTSNDLNVEEDWVEPVKMKYCLEYIELVHEQITARRLEDPGQLNKLHQKISQILAKKYKVMMGKSELHKYYNYLVNRGDVPPSYIVDSVTKTKNVRSRSGVLPISLATDGNNFSCAYDCYFCPDESKKNGAPRDMSRSYLSSEGTFIRGAIEDFEPANQIWRRLMELELMGHPPDKLEMIILGGTWDSYDEKYREYFLHQIFYACNVFSRISLRMDGDLSHLTREWADLNPFRKGMRFDESKVIQSQLRPPNSLQEEKAENEVAKCARVIGIVLETRPDQISKKSLLRKRRLGCTRLQLGFQHTDDEILKYNNRGHNVAKSVDAVQCARDNCFKVDGHLMPDLPGTTYEKDIEMIDRIFGGDDLQLDYCKLYPCLDLPYTVTRKWKESGEWKPLAEHNFPVFLDIMRIACARTPPWTRINRVQRDFPEAQENNDYLGFVSDNIRSNLQQYVVQELEKHGQTCYDIRSREIKNAFPLDFAERAKLMVRTYRSNHGTEFFLSVELPQRKPKSIDDAILMGLLRLRMTDFDCDRLAGKNRKTPFHLLPEFTSRPIALIRELHVYGNIQMVQKDIGKTTSQHTGVGKFLMAVAETIAKAYHFQEIAVISGVGVRGYYKKLGYHMDNGEGEYLIKSLIDTPTVINDIETQPDPPLPLRLFDREFAQEDILAPISSLVVPNKYMAIRPKYDHLPHLLYPSEPWYEISNYPLIQNGEPQVVSIDNKRKISWWRSPPVITSFIVGCGLLFLVARKR